MAGSIYYIDAYFMNTKENEKRINKLLEVLVKYISMDFSEKAELSDAGDELDAFAVGLNTLGEELEALRSAEKNYIQNLRESEKRFRLVVESVKDYAIFMVTTDGFIESWSSGAEQIKGYTSEEITGKHISVFYTKDRIEAGEVERSLKHAGMYGRHENEGWQIRKDNTKFWANVVITALYDEQDIVKGFVKVTRDFTELKNAKDELERKVEERTAQLLEYAGKLQREISEKKITQSFLIKSNKELREYAYVISHDLKAPLRAIGTLCDILIEDHYEQLDDSGKEKLEIMKNRAVRMDKMILGILEYSQVGRSGKEALVFGAVNFNDLVNEVIGLAATSSHVSVKIKNTLPCIECNVDAMTRVFQNLISNAVKFNDKPGAVVEIGCIEEKDEWKFYVADNGIGISEKYHKKIFQIFQTLASRDEKENTGLGLAIVKKIVEQNGGRIWVESEETKGAVFYFTIPKALEII